MGKFSRLGNDLYNGRKSDRLRRPPRLWYAISARHRRWSPSSVVVLKGLNFGIEFTGGTAVPRHLPPSEVTQDDADELREAVAGAGHRGAAAPVVTTAGNEAILVQTEALTPDGERPRSPTRHPRRPVVDRATSPRTRSARAGARRSPSAPLIGLVVFLVLVVLFIWAYFREWKMSVAAIVALVHDILDHGRRLRAVRLRGHAGDRHRPADDPGLLALRHGRRLRQGPREHPRACGRRARPTPRRRTSRSTRPWSARSTPRSWR